MHYRGTGRRILVAGIIVLHGLPTPRIIRAGRRALHLNSGSIRAPGCLAIEGDRASKKKNNAGVLPPDIDTPPKIMYPILFHASHAFSPFLGLPPPPPPRSEFPCFINITASQSHRMDVLILYRDVPCYQHVTSIWVSANTPGSIAGLKKQPSGITACQFRLLLILNRSV